MVAECIRKLTIWHTPTFTPIITHDQLDPILSTLGFLPLAPVTAPDTPTVLKEYSFPAAGSLFPPPRPRLPYPRIDGLHVNTYRSFLESIDFYIRMDNISDLFHVRGMPLHLVHDKHHKWVPSTKDDLVYVYREGAIDLKTVYKNADKDKNRSLHIVPWKNIMVV